VILGADQLIAALPFVLRRWGLDPRRVRREAIAAAFAEARLLAAGDEHLEPAALFYALAGRPRGLGAAWIRLTQLVAVTHAQRLGLALPADADELRSLCVRIAASEVGFEDARAWFATRICFTTWAPGSVLACT